MNPIDQLKQHCGTVDGEFNSNNPKTKASCTVDNSKIIMNRGREKTGARVEMDDNNTTVKGRIQAGNNHLEVESDPDFVAGQSILMVKNPNGESIEITSDK